MAELTKKSFLKYLISAFEYKNGVDKEEMFLLALKLLDKVSLISLAEYIQVVHQNFLLEIL